MFYELSAKSHIQIPCYEFTGGIVKKQEEEEEEKKNVENESEISNGNLIEEIMKHLWAEYCNKIIPPDHGLCITVSGIDKIGDAQIFMEDGSTYVDVEFRLIIFKPYKNQIIEGCIATSDESGIRVSLGFFEQVFIPNYNLPQQSKFDKTTKTWIWPTTNGDTLSFDKDDVINLKVIKTTFKPQKDDNNNNNDNKQEKKEEDKDEDQDEDIDIDIEQNKNKSKIMLLENKLLTQPMIVYGSLKGNGLGPTSWWT